MYGEMITTDKVHAEQESLNETVRSMYKESMTIMSEVEVREKDSGFANERKESQAMVTGQGGFIIESQAPKRCLCFKKKPPQTAATHPLPRDYLTACE